MANIHALKSGGMCTWGTSCRRPAAFAFEMRAVKLTECRLAIGDLFQIAEYCETCVEFAKSCAAPQHADAWYSGAIRPITKPSVGDEVYIALEVGALLVNRRAA